MSEHEKKLTHVLFEFDDGTAEEIVGPLADEWYKQLKSNDTFLWAHGMGWPKHLAGAWKCAFVRPRRYYPDVGKDTR